MMLPSFSPPGFGRRRRATSESTNDSSHSSRSRKPSRVISQMDDWSDGFTGLVDLDRRMRKLAMSDQDVSSFGLSDGLCNNEAYSLTTLSLTERVQSRRHSTSESRPNSSPRSSLAIGQSNPSIGPSYSSTMATSRFSQDSRRASLSLLSKRRSIAGNTIDSFESVHSALRLAPLPTSASVLSNSRLTNASAFFKSTRSTSTLSASSWTGEEDELSHPALVGSMASRQQQEALSPGTAAAATWMDPSAPSYFAACIGGSRGDYKHKSRSLYKKLARAPLPRLVSGEVVSSPVAESAEPRRADALYGMQMGELDTWQSINSHLTPDRTSDDVRHAGMRSSAASHTVTHTLRRSAQSLALNLRFKLIRARRSALSTRSSDVRSHST
ncbi:uncharacterized protein UMAG_00230 [Mycosarcoma maydis]|uniref:Uncharacterized protein n=1 Tax=Mycosarcoma maydis TaxID=5270 RepID=A0A0D1CFL4_MYCMD|nr:uncharacterized protein UMAG_00230 [Ustilago maydis 521]KIS71797.1 hypothetical protein UMAG_00230 [Ustilago maydis 521]|eukprot:XP_011386162.1 hypothetical protein UMAG_00230 [Ustilago maydis 521]